MRDLEKAKGLCAQLLASGRYGFFESCVLAARAAKVLPTELAGEYPLEHQARFRLHNSDFDQAERFIVSEKEWISPDPGQIAARFDLEDGSYQVRYVHAQIGFARLDVFDGRSNLTSRRYYSSIEDMISDLSK